MVPVQLGDRRKLQDFGSSSIAGCNSCVLICELLGSYTSQIETSKDHTIEVAAADGLAGIAIHLDTEVIKLEVTASEGMSFVRCKRDIPNAQSVSKQLAVHTSTQRLCNRSS